MKGSVWTKNQILSVFADIYMGQKECGDLFNEVPYLIHTILIFF